MGKKGVKAMRRRVPPAIQKREGEVAEEDINPDLKKYFEINHSLNPPYNVILDTNFINMSLRRKLDIERELIKCLSSRVTMCITECVIAELEKLGKVHILALKVVKGPKFKRLSCDHKGTYADSCFIERVKVHPCFIIATCDKELKQKLRKVPGVPILAVHGMRYEVEALPTTDIFKV